MRKDYPCKTKSQALLAFISKRTRMRQHSGLFFLQLFTINFLPFFVIHFLNQNYICN